jgi:hypothetical protein
MWFPMFSSDTQGILSCDARMGYAADPLVLDERGCSDRCTAVDPDTQELMVGRSDGVYFYTGTLLSVTVTPTVHSYEHPYL